MPDATIGIEITAKDNTKAEIDKVQAELDDVKEKIADIAAQEKITERVRKQSLKDQFTYLKAKKKQEETAAKNAAKEREKAEKEVERERKKSLKDTFTYLKTKKRQEVAEAKRAAKARVSAINSIATAAGAAGTAIGGLGTVLSTNILSGGVEIESLKDTFRVFEEGDADRASNAIDELVKLSQQPGITFGAAVKGAQKLYSAGLKLGEITPIISALGNAVALSGGGEMKLKNALDQLAKTIGKNKVEMENLTSLIDNAPILGKALREEFGDLATSGEGLTEAILASNSSLKEFWVLFSGSTLPAQGAASADTAQNAISNLKNASDLLYQSFGETLLPEMKAVLTEVTNLINGFNNLDPPVQKIIAATVVLSTGFLNIAAPILTAAANFGILKLAFGGTAVAANAATAAIGTAGTAGGAGTGVIASIGALTAKLTAFSTAIGAGSVIFVALAGLIGKFTALKDAADIATGAETGSGLAAALGDITTIDGFNTALQSYIDKLETAQGVESTLGHGDLAKPQWEWFTDPETGERTARAVAIPEGEMSAELKAINDELQLMQELAKAEGEPNKQIELLETEITSLKGEYNLLVSEGMTPTDTAAGELNTKITNLESITASLKTAAGGAATNTASLGTAASEAQTPVDNLKSAVEIDETKKEGFMQVDADSATAVATESGAAETASGELRTALDEDSAEKGKGFGQEDADSATAIVDESANAETAASEMRKALDAEIPPQGYGHKDAESATAIVDESGKAETAASEMRTALDAEIPPQGYGHKDAESVTAIVDESGKAETAASEMRTALDAKSAKEGKGYGQEDAESATAIVDESGKAETAAGEMRTALDAESAKEGKGYAQKDADSAFDIVTQSGAAETAAGEMRTALDAKSAKEGKGYAQKDADSAFDVVTQSGAAETAADGLRKTLDDAVPDEGFMSTDKDSVDALATASENAKQPITLLQGALNTLGEAYGNAIASQITLQHLANIRSGKPSDLLGTGVSQEDIEDLNLWQLRKDMDELSDSAEGALDPQRYEDAKTAIDAFYDAKVKKAADSDKSIVQKAITTGNIESDRMQALDNLDQKFSDNRSARRVLDLEGILTNKQTELDSAQEVLDNAIATGEGIKAARQGVVDASAALSHAEMHLAIENNKTIGATEIETAKLQQNLAIETADIKEEHLNRIEEVDKRVADAAVANAERVKAETQKAIDTTVDAITSVFALAHATSALLDPNATHKQKFGEVGRILSEVGGYIPGPVGGILKILGVKAQGLSALLPEEDKEENQFATTGRGGRGGPRTGANDPDRAGMKRVRRGREWVWVRDEDAEEEPLTQAQQRAAQNADRKRPTTQITQDNEPEKEKEEEEEEKQPSTAARRAGNRASKAAPEEEAPAAPAKPGGFKPASTPVEKAEPKAPVVDVKQMQEGLRKWEENIENAVIAEERQKQRRFHDPSRDRIAELAAARLAHQSIGKTRRNLYQSAADFSDSFVKGIENAGGIGMIGGGDGNAGEPIVVENHIHLQMNDKTVQEFVKTVNLMQQSGRVYLRS